MPYQRAIADAMPDLGRLSIKAATDRLFVIIALATNRQPKGRDMPANNFIDGESGTTGLGSRARLKSHSDIELLSRPRGARTRARRKRRWNKVVLCLPAMPAADIRHDRCRVDSHQCRPRNRGRKEKGGM
jgi:hypothetical protein